MDMSELLQLMAGMQQHTQGQLPVTPNNGNPHGANNMPAADANEGGPLQRPGGGFYPWLNPSPSVDVIHQLISSIGTGGNQPAQQVPGAPLPMSTGGNDPAMGVPVLPNQNNGNTGIVPPSYQQHNRPMLQQQPQLTLPQRGLQQYTR